MARWILVLALAALLAPAAAAEAPRTPAALVNGAAVVAQVGEMGPVELTFDVRTLGARGVRVLLQRWPTRPGVPPAREWRFDVDHGVRQVKMNGLPIGIYVVQAVATDGAGTDVGSESIPIYVEYGGWRAWDGIAVQEDLRAAPPPFAGVGASYIPRIELPRVELAPATSVLKPGAEIELKATVRNLPEETPVEWALDGPGSLDVIDPWKVKYTAPDTYENEVARIRATIQGAEEGHATILVTSVRVEN